MDHRPTATEKLIASPSARTTAGGLFFPSARATSAAISPRTVGNSDRLRARASSPASAASSRRPASDSAPARVASALASWRDGAVRPGLYGLPRDLNRAIDVTDRTRDIRREVQRHLEHRTAEATCGLDSLGRMGYGGVSLTGFAFQRSEVTERIRQHFGGARGLPQRGQNLFQQ